MRPICMQKTSSPVYATPFFFFFFVRRTLTKTFFFFFSPDWSRTFNSSLEVKPAFTNMKHHWKLIVDTVQSFVKWRCWFSQMDLILLILSLTPLNLVTNWKSCIVEFRCRKYWSHLEMCPRGGVWRLYWRAKTNPSGHTTLGHNHKLCSCFYNHFFLNCLSMKGQQARLSERSQDQMDDSH